MARLLVLAASAPLLLLGAAYPEDKPDADYPDEAGYIEEAPVTYRPCRPGPGDDNCIQLYERGVRASYARWLREHDVPGPRTEVAMGGPVEAVDEDEPEWRKERGHHTRRQHGDRRHRCEDDDRHVYDGEVRG